MRNGKSAFRFQLLDEFLMNNEQARMPVLPWRLVATLLPFLLRWVDLAWARHRWWRRFYSRRHWFSFRLRVCRTLFGLRRGRQRHLLQLWFASGGWRSSRLVFVRLGRVFINLRTLSGKLSLPLTEQFLHVLRHGSRLRKIFFRFVLQEVLLEVDEVGKRADGASHFISERSFPTGITHPNAGHVRRRITEKPDVGVIVDGASLAGQWYTKRPRRASSAKFNYPAHHRNHR